MAIKVVSEIGSEVIRTKAKPVNKITAAEVKRVVSNLVDTMRAVELVGMAAPQIGVGSRIFVTEIRKTKLHKDPALLDSVRVFINPVITKSSKKKVLGYEGCGSVAAGGLFGEVKRHETIAVRAFDENGEEFELETSGLLSIIIQHEMDHLNGVCFIDKVTDTKKLLGRGEYLKMKKNQLKSV